MVTFGLCRYSLWSNNNDTFWQKIESMLYNVALAKTAAIKGTPQTKLYEELGLETLNSGSGFKGLCTLTKIKTSSLPK